MSLAQSLTALVLEDHDFQRHSLIRMLNSICMKEIYQASHGVEALEILNSVGKIDLIFCDLDMPKMDGIEFIRHLSRHDSSPSLIISSATDHAIIKSVEKMATEYGVSFLGLLDKPANVKQITELIKKHLSITTVHKADALNFTIEEILEGIEKKQFEPFFQPKIDFKSGLISGAEALARWIHPDHGVIAPYAFIEKLEYAGKIDLLTFQILEKSASACRTWLDRGLNVTVSVNLSLAGLEDPAIVEVITKIAHKAAIEPNQISLEITETAAMTDSGPALEILARLRMRGFGLSVDDYGTGFSSLKQLTRVPFSELKIDQSFVTGCTSDFDLFSIVNSSVEMARALGLKSVAEGIENQEEWDALMDIECNIGQGYFISRPINLENFLKKYTQ